MTETAMGHKRMGKDDDGFKYAMAVMKYIFLFRKFNYN